MIQKPYPKLPHNILDIQRHIYTERLTLIPLDFTDSLILHPHITDAVTQLWIGWDTPKHPLETTNAVDAAIKQRNQGKYQGWIACLNFDNGGGRGPDRLDGRFGGDCMVGFVELAPLDAAARGDAWYELNFWVIEKEWGKGYATEMAIAIAQLLRDNNHFIPCVNLSWTHGNVASKRVIEKLIGDQKPEIVPTEKNGVLLPVYHYVLDMSPPSRPLSTNADSMLLQDIAKTDFSKEVTEKELWSKGRELLYFIGVNGAGKSTLGKRLADRCVAQSGKVIFDSESRAYNKAFDCANTGSTDPAVHNQVVGAVKALIDEWKRSDANLVIVDRWFESYDIELPLACHQEIVEVLQTSGFNVRVVHLVIGGYFATSDDFAIMRERMAHTKATRPAAWWETGSGSLDERVQAELDYQAEYRKFLQRMPFSSVTIPTTLMDWDSYEESIVNGIKHERQWAGFSTDKAMTTLGEIISNLAGRRNHA